MNQYPTICGKCDASLRESSYNSNYSAACPQCYTPAWAYVFPAWTKGEEEVVAHSDADIGQASCFNHETKRAASICDDCGKFLCGLCSISYAGKQLCTSCISATKRGESTLKVSARRPDIQALWLSVVGMFIPLLGLAMSSFSLYLIFKYWNVDESYIAHSKWRFVVAGLLSSLIILGTIGFIVVEVFG